MAYKMQKCPTWSVVQDTSHAATGHSHECSEPKNSPPNNGRVVESRGGSSSWDSSPKSKTGTRHSREGMAGPICKKAHKKAECFRAKATGRSCPAILFLSVCLVLVWVSLHTATCEEVQRENVSFPVPFLCSFLPPFLLLLSIERPK